MAQATNVGQSTKQIEGKHMNEGEKGTEREKRTPKIRSCACSIFRDDEGSAETKKALQRIHQRSTGVIDLHKIVPYHSAVNNSHVGEGGKCII